MNHFRKSGARGAAAGNVLALLLFAGLIALGAWLWLGRKDAGTVATADGSRTTVVQAGEFAQYALGTIVVHLTHAQVR